MDDKKKIINAMENMGIFTDENHIPSVPIIDEETYKQYVIPNYIRCGAIPKKDLIDNSMYLGSCRNASKAVWHANENCFVYERHKFGYTYNENINHFEDDNGYDLFVPIKKISQ